MTSGDLGPLDETAQAVRVMKEKYMLWQQRLDSLVAQVPALLHSFQPCLNFVLSLFYHHLNAIAQCWACWQLHGRAVWLPV